MADRQHDHLVAVQPSARSRQVRPQRHDRLITDHKGATKRGYIGSQTHGTHVFHGRGGTGSDNPVEIVATSGTINGGHYSVGWYGCAIDRMSPHCLEVAFPNNLATYPLLVPDPTWMIEQQ